MEQLCVQKDFINERNGFVESAQYFEGSELDGLATLNETIEMSQAMANRLNFCQECGGMVVDLATGKLYCGLNTPNEVIKSNSRILTS